MTRDLTKKQFVAQIEKRGWQFQHLGYVDCDGVSICRFNAGDRLRTQLAYLINEKIRFEERQAKRKREQV